jgi:hypothetical protein
MDGQAACEAAAVSLGNSDTSASVRSLQDKPPGCYMINQKPPSVNPPSLWFNTDTTATANCSSTSTCLCVTEMEIGSAPDAGPAVLGISLLVIYSFGILLFMGSAINIALSAVKKHVKNFARTKTLAEWALVYEKRRKQREQNPNEQEERNELEKEKNKTYLHITYLQQEARDQREIERIENESEAKNDENENWKLVGWLMEDYRYPLFELWNGALDGAICCCSLLSSSLLFCCCC